MKITAIRAFPVWVGIRNQLIVKVETDEGLFGWGESGLSGREKAVIGAIEHFAEFAVGRDPLRIGALWQEMYRSQYFEGGRALTAAISAIDIALHDLAGKTLGVPVHQLLGGKQRDRIPTFASTRAPPGEEMIAQAKQRVRSGGGKASFFCGTSVQENRWLRTSVFHGAFCVLMFQHVSDEEMQRWIREVSWSLASGGVFCFQWVPEADLGPYSFPHAVSDVSKWCREAGMPIQKLEMSRPEWLWATARKEEK